ncbi:MAG: hypothetical protein JWM11_5717 [Planctomycetaceae bacterium]|nr:hypothetical protein [Planctomycetaceae bacterium]
MGHNSDLTPPVIFGLGWLYLLLTVMNVWWTARIMRTDPHRDKEAAGWGMYAGLLLMATLAHLTGSSTPEHFHLRMPQIIQQAIDWCADPKIYFAGTTALFIAVVWLRKWFIQETVAWVLLNLSVLFLTLSMTDYDFRQIVGKPDNVPIVSMLFIVGFFTWLYFKRAVDNDERRAAGRPLFEQEKNEKILVWPDLVYTELICMVVCTVVLVVWALLLPAPLEEPASAVQTPNPSKAPWYFLGLQEMLVYFDPWMAGVVLPSMILVGLMAIPYIDFNKLGNGYYTFNERKFAILTFMFGFLPLWIGMIILGTFLRGPNWNFFGIYEPWDSHKLEVLNNVNLSEYFWLIWCGSKMPTAPAGSDQLTQTGYILTREWLGLVACFAYLAITPMILAATVFKKFFIKMGFIRFMVFSNLLLFMASLPIKMLLRWMFRLKYIVGIPEWFFNI